MTIALIGATGLTGRSLVPLLSARHQLHLFGRRASGFEVRESVAPAVEWPELVRQARLDIAISALGTTWNEAGSWPAFEAVDRDAVIGFAEAARDAGTRHFLTISSVGADPGSRNRYLALKGEVEQALGRIGFDRLDVLRPGLLRGARGSNRRRGERIGIFVSPLVNLVLRGPLDRFAAIDASKVAAAIAALAGAGGSGTFVHHNREVHALAARSG